MTKRKIYKPRAISGFPELLPEERMVELAWMDEVRRVFESYGFASIETPSVEELDVLVAKGETDKEIYTLTRLQADERDKSDARLGLHFDVTVPFARYVGQHFNELTFPFKRYQMQKVWRGERPQEGRFREFYQCDIDVISIDNLPLGYDAEMPAIIYEILEKLDIGAVQLHISNRKILDGYLAGLGVEDTIAAIRIIDKMDKIGVEGVVADLVEEAGLEADIAARAVKLAEICTEDVGFVEAVEALGVENEILAEGLEELRFVMAQLAGLPKGAVVADLAIARGFDYYTGTVYEGKFVDYPEFGSICSGGRYDDLAGAYINKRLPGVGMSIGLTRIFAKIQALGKLGLGRKCPTDILVILPSEGVRAVAMETAATLRGRGFNVELFPNAAKLKKQLSYANKKAIPYIWFPPFDDDGVHEVKNMETGEQVEAVAENWVG